MKYGEDENGKYTDIFIECVELTCVDGSVISINKNSTVSYAGGYNSDTYEKVDDSVFVYRIEPITA